MQTLLVMVFFMLISLGPGVVLGVSDALTRRSPAGFAAGFIVTLLVVIAIALLPYSYALRAMRPLLAGVPRTAERTLRRRA